MSDQPLWALSAGQLAQAFAADSATPVQALEAVLARHDAVNPRLNAVVTLDRAGAQAAARASAGRWARGEALGLLDGVPLTIKDNILTAGLRSTWGSACYADFVPERDETPVARLRAAGAVILGKTNVPEFTVQGVTDNALFGPTRNPWNPGLTPGGSSGGAVAAVASGIGPLALCTDGGGSIRRPAAHAGLVGLKPSRGLVPRRHGFPAILDAFEVVGPVGRCVGDVRAMLRIIAGTGEVSTPPVAQRIAFIPRFGEAPVDPAIAASVAGAAERFAGLGHAVERLGDFTLAEPVNAIWSIVSEAGVAWLLDAHLKLGRDAPVQPGIAAMAERGRNHSASDYLGMLRTLEAAGEAFEALFSRFDLLLMPATAAQPWPVGQTHPDVIDGQSVGPRGHAVFTAFANALGLPGLTLPARPDRDGMPIGFQLIGPQGADDRLLALGAAYEQAFGGFPMPVLAGDLG
ncbi:aspartyl-tRNA(Asn)/glutamyl-tRNA(Gln) amidotransferase subunit A [Bosea sp. OK403]|uniref:amidase n=1 Tax=Bosea sp. OK403 TaxID=1855286 RepID=UPI0008E461BD|nr:amidase [Bosea sp. OK403]SFH94440.1 aspartyl-tRNA(Asn)/glutamyl-tRNA(Gln) amidotransferase subunit A [Bosea sp. OK403]